MQQHIDVVIELRAGEAVLGSHGQRAAVIHQCTEDTRVPLGFTGQLSIYFLMELFYDLGNFGFQPADVLLVEATLVMLDSLRGALAAPHRFLLTGLHPR